MLRVDLARLDREGPLSVAGAIEVGGLFEEDAASRFNADPVVELQISSAGSGEVMVMGTLRGTFTLECRRCLSVVNREIETEVSMVFSPSDDLAEDDGEIRLIEPSETELDLGPPVREELILSVPSFAECRPDCRGLCPHCGVNLNEGDCDCGGGEPDSRWDALRALKDE